MHILSAVAISGVVGAADIQDDLFLAHQSLEAGADELGFGAATATYGDRFVAGHHWHALGGTKSGSVSLFNRVVSEDDPNRPWTWAKAGTLAPASGQWPHTWFGSAIDIAGSSVIVGAPRWDEGVDPGDVDTQLVDCGAAWIFDAQDAENTDGVTLPAAALTIDDLQLRDYFGCAVAIDGDRAIVGAWGHDLDPAAADNTGAAFVFERQGDGDWLHVGTLQPPVAQPNGRFGMAVAIDGDFALVGAPWAFTYSGVVHVFRRIDGVWQWSQQVDNPGTPYARFGTSLAMEVYAGEHGDEGGFIAGAPGDSTAGPQAGRAFGFGRTTNGSSFITPPEYELSPPETAPWDEVGASVSLLVIDNEDQNGNNDDSDGIAVVLLGSPGANDGQGEVQVLSLSDDEVVWEGVFAPADAASVRSGHSVAVEYAELPEWDQSLVRVFVSAPGIGGVELGNIDVYEIVPGDSDGDCDGDGVWDFLSLEQNDCDGDGWYDVCQLMHDQSSDCDGSGVIDVCELSALTDCDDNGVLDLCEPDLDGDGITDACDDDMDGDGWPNGVDAFPMDASEWLDTDGDGQGDNADDDDDDDGVSDDCDSDQTAGVDCDVNGVLDSCEVNSITDCNEDGLLDACQLNEVADCNEDGILDACQINSNTDCDNNGMLDECQGDPASDCNLDGILDICQLDGMSDCNGNSILDQCETGWSDCDENGIADLCQVQANPSLDCNQDMILDSCQEIGGVGDPSWSTERYFGDFDLSGLGVLFDDSDSDLIYTTCTVDMQNNWIVEPSGGTQLTLGDDAFVPVQLPFPFTFKGVTYNTMEVGSNGYITFGGQGDAGYTETLASHFAMPRISAVFDDLHPYVEGEDGHGEVRTGVGPQGDFIHVSWIDVGHYRDSSTDPLRMSSFQIVLYADGAIDMCWLSSEASSAIAGLSGGTGQPAGFAETDLSNAMDCVSRVPADYGDCDGDGVMDNCQIPLIGDPWWMTEQFVGGFDMSGWVAQLNPTGSSTPPAWSLCTDAAAQAAFIPPTGGIMLLAEDDVPTQVVFGNVDGALANFDFDYAGATFTDCWMSPNGYITFGSGDNAYEESLAKHFELPRVSVLFHDLDPTKGGYMHVGAGPAGSFVATWHQIPHYWDVSQISTAQIQLHPDGAITLVWLEVGAHSAIIGLSDGMGIPQGFAETDYSLAFDCQLRHALDDCNANGIYDSIEIALGCGQDDDFDGLLNECDESPALPVIIVWDPTACPGDVDGNQAVDVRDLICLLQCWNSNSEQCIRSDMDDSGTVGPGDVLLLVQQLGTTCD